jgi:hypothetical protein
MIERQLGEIDLQPVRDDLKSAISTALGMAPMSGFSLT